MGQIAIVAPEGIPIPPIRGGSVQIYITQLIKALANVSPDTLTLISPSESSLSSNHSSHIVVQTNASDYQAKVLHHLHELQPDIIQIENRPNLVLEVAHQFPSAKLILNLHSTTFLKPNHISKERAKHVLTRSHQVIVNSDYLQQKLAKDFSIGIDEWRVQTIYPGVDRTTFAMSQLTDKFSFHRNHPIQLLFVGRIIPRKGVHILIQMMKKMKAQNAAATLYIVGRAPNWAHGYERKLISQARHLPVIFTGFVEPEALPTYYRRAHLLICPSQRDEAFGLVNLEAMSTGLPVIASEIGGIPEVVNHSCGILVRNANHPSSFAKAVVRLKHNQGLYQQLQLGAQKRAALFSWEQTARQFQSLYSQLLRTNDEIHPAMSDAANEIGP